MMLISLSVSLYKLAACLVRCPSLIEMVQFTIVRTSLGEVLFLVDW
jgi:hypothetical protein